MAQNIRSVHWTTARRMSAPFLIMGVSIWMLHNVIDLNALTSLPAKVAALPLGLLTVAGLLCALSFWAVARYDGLAHRHFGTDVDPRLARRSGFAAIAVAQTVGFGVLSGTAVRWRMLPELGLIGALQVATFVSVTFMAAFAFVASLACLILPTPIWMTQPAIFLAVGLPLALLSLSFAPVFAPLRRKVQIPSLRTAGHLLCWTALDVIAASLALYLLLPADTLSFAVFLPVFLLALGAAMASGAPGGVGPFELTLISLLPQVPTAELVAAIIAFRALYYALPALIAVVVLFSTKRPILRPQQGLLPARRLPAELGILAQNGGRIHAHRASALALWQTTQTATQLFDPIEGTPQDALHALTKEARRTSRLPCVYKCSARMAQTARANGWSVARIAQDCVVPLETYELALPSRRSLRRKLRQAEKAGVTITRAETLPLSLMADLDAAWQVAQGAARGGTMGRYCPAYVARQDVYLAYQHGKLIAFGTFHVDQEALCLDLMRHTSDVAQGTMHLIVQTAIATAQTEGKSHVSLAAIPDMPSWTARTGPFRHKFTNNGLSQFKRSFAPRMVPKYAAAPSHASLALALADITTEVFWPQPLPTRGKAHKQDEEYEVALNWLSWKGISQLNNIGR